MSYLTPVVENGPAAEPDSQPSQQSDLTEDDFDAGTVVTGATDVSPSEDIVAADPTRKARGRYPDHPPHPTASSVHIAAHPHRRAASRSPHLHRHHQQ